MAVAIFLEVVSVAIRRESGHFLSKVCRILELRHKITVDQLKLPEDSVLSLSMCSVSLGSQLSSSTDEACIFALLLNCVVFQLLLK